MLKSYSHCTLSLHLATSAVFFLNFCALWVTVIQTFLPNRHELCCKLRNRWRNKSLVTKTNCRNDRDVLICMLLLT